MKPKAIQPTATLGLLAAALTALLATPAAHAAVGTWNGPTLTGTWDTTTTNWTGVTGTPWAAVGNTALFNTSDNAANVSGAIFASIIQIDSSGNLVNVAGGATVNQNVGSARLYIMGTGHTSAAQGNSLTISTPGSVATPTYSYYLNGGNSTMWIGGDGAWSATGPTYSYDNVTVSNGAYFRIGGGSGNTNSLIGANVNSNYNSLIVRGFNGTSPSTFSNAGQRLYVGGYGNYNSMTVDQGGQSILRVFHVGAGGSNNSVLVDGTGNSLPSYLAVREDMFIGDTDSSRVGTNNTVTVSGGAKLDTTTRSGRTEFSVIVGKENGSNNNSLTITGAGSLWNDNVLNAGYQVVIGGAGSPTAFTAKATALNNSININSGASAQINTGVWVYGGNSSLNLGDGTGISSAAIGSTRDGGVLLGVADARLNFNSGRLTANVDGTLVSGAGEIVLNGPAYISTAYAGSTISSAISGSGTLIKEGAGTLTLSSSAATYSGSATIAQGTLALTTLSPGSGKTLKGNGTVSGVIDMTNGSTFAYEVNSDTVTGNLLTVNGPVTLENSNGDKVFLTLDDLATTDVAFATGTKFSVMNYSSSLNGQFFYGASTTPLGEGGTFETALNRWTINYSESTGGINFIGTPTGGFINLTAGALTAIPEPGSLLALGCLVGSGAFLRSRRRTK